MQSQQNGTITFLALQRLAERAWDQGDALRLARLSAALDAATVASLSRETGQPLAISSTV